MIRRLVRQLLLWVALCVILPAANAFEADIYGRWKVTKILDAAEIASLPESEAKKLIGTKVSILRDRLVVAGVECMHPSYKYSYRNTAATLREEWRVSAARMRLPVKMVVVDAECTSVFLDPNRPQRLVFHWEGYFFEAVRKLRR